MLVSEVEGLYVVVGNWWLLSVAKETAEAAAEEGEGRLVDLHRRGGSWGRWCLWW